MAGFAVAEWVVRLGRPGERVRFVFPVAMLAGGLLLLFHTHAIAKQREALLVELSHLPLAVLAVVAGGAPAGPSCAGGPDLRGPPPRCGPPA